MANISGWMIHPVDDITEFYCILFIYNIMFLEFADSIDIY